MGCFITHVKYFFSQTYLPTCSAIISTSQTDENYPARPEIKQSLTGWGDNCGSESSTLETDVCVWCYALLVVHATQEEEEEEDW